MFIDLNDSISNYDILLVETCVTSSGMPGALEVKLLDVSSINFTNLTSSSDYAYNTYTKAASGNPYYRVLFNFVNDTKIKIIRTDSDGTTWTDARITKVTGIKF